MSESALKSSFDREKTAEMLKALGHPVRLKVIHYLLSNTCCCCGELCDCFDHSQSTVSQHLGVLRDAEILIADKKGNRMLYSINPDAFEYLQDQFASLMKRAKKLENK